MCQQAFDKFFNPLMKMFIILSSGMAGFMSIVPSPHALKTFVIVKSCREEVG